MVAMLQQGSRRQTAVPVGTLPARMRILYITTGQRTGGWLADAFAADSASEILLEEAVGVSAGLARLRDEMFDAVLLSHEPGELDALEFLEAMHGGGSEQPMVVLGAQSESELAAMSFEVGADAYLCVNTTTTRTLIWTVARAIERRHLIRDNRRVTHADERRVQQEHAEAQWLLEQQRALIRDLVDSESLRTAGGNPAPAGERTPDSPGAPAAPALPPQLVSHYRELLRAYIIMGSGNLGVEMITLSELLATAGITARQTLELHVHVVEELVRGLGNRSARHVMNRADLLALEVMIHLAEGYRQRYELRIPPPQQMQLPFAAR